MKHLIILILGIILSTQIYAQKSGCISGNCENGYGTYVWGKESKYSGDKYVGNWKNSAMHGQGTYYWASGEKYEGNWKDGLQDGNGKMTYADGTVDSGTWKNGEFTGSKNIKNNDTNKTGCIYGDCQNGNGMFVFDTGDMYLGDWKNSSLHGDGTYTFVNGDSYVGQFKEGSFAGVGTYTWSNGDKYIGDWKDNLQHGNGTFVYKDGSTEKGVWADGEFKGKAENLTGCISGDCDNGYGTYVWKKGDKYEGNWKNGKLNGQGNYYFATGEKYLGEWKNGKRNGYGTNYYISGKIEEGLWEDDRYIGSGKNNYGCISGDCENGWGIYTFESGERYEGNWKNNARNGKGTNIYAIGSTYTGTWLNNQQHGYGTYTYHKDSELEKYVGDYVNHVIEGYGTLTYKNGQKYIGQFSQGYKHGEGTMYYPKGKIESGVWEYDVFKGSKSISKGCISGNCTDGFGTWVSEDGDKYIGTFKNGTYNGQGTYTFFSGGEYTGQFKNGKFSGQGTYVTPKGEKYVGEFNNGTYNGFGTYYFSDGTSKNGNWKDGSFVDYVQKATPPKVSWLTPQYFNTTSDVELFAIKVCIGSTVELENVQIFVNDKLQINNATRGYSVVSTNCDYTLEREISLSPGENKVKVIVTNSGGKTESDVRNISYQVKQSTVTQKKLALVIGNSKYNSAPLRNPANDAVAIAKELKSLDFEVMVFTELSQNEMKTKIREFGVKLNQQKGVGLFYFAGHGIQLNGENYLIPVDARIEKEQDVELESVNLKRIMGELDYAQNEMNIVILDACRNNPFARSFRSQNSGGLAATDAPIGTFIAYATAPEKTAADGEGANGLYTEELLAAMRTPGLKIEDVFKLVRKNVIEKSKKQQVPWENSSIVGDFYFKK